MKVSFDNPTELTEQDRVNSVGSAMIIYGGSFVKVLGRALVVADSINIQKIKEAFPREWNEYTALAEIDYLKYLEID